MTGFSRYSAIPAGGAAGGSSGGGTRLFEWNRVDTSQFDVANTWVSGVVTAGSLTVVTRETGPALRIEGARTGSGAGRLSVPVIIGSALPGTYRVHMRLRQSATGVIPDWAGLEFLSNGLAGASRYGLCAMNDQNGFLGQAGVAPPIQAGVHGSDWATFNGVGWADGTTPNFGSVMDYSIAANLAAAKPEGGLLFEAVAGQNGTSGAWASMRKFVQTTFLAGWDLTAPLTIGLCASDVSAGANLAIAWEVSELSVYQI